MQSMPVNLVSRSLEWRAWEGPNKASHYCLLSYSKVSSQHTNCFQSQPDITGKHLQQACQRGERRNSTTQKHVEKNTCGPDAHMHTFRLRVGGSDTIQSNKHMQPSPHPLALTGPRKVRVHRRFRLRSSRAAPPTLAAAAASAQLHTKAEVTQLPASASVHTGSSLCSTECT
jgi:hypothetical protein